MQLSPAAAIVTVGSEVWCHYTASLQSSCAQESTSRRKSQIRASQFFFFFLERSSHYQSVPACLSHCVRVATAVRALSLPSLLPDLRGGHGTQVSLASGLFRVTHLRDRGGRMSSETYRKHFLCVCVYSVLSSDLTKPCGSP